MANEYFSIDAADGVQLTTGIAPSKVLEQAQRMANERNEVVHYYSSTNEDDCGDVYPESSEPEADTPPDSRRTQDADAYLERWKEDRYREYEEA